MAGTTRTDLALNDVGIGVSQFVQAGEYAFFAEGTFNGGTVSLQVQSPHGTFIPVTGASVLANGMVVVKLPAGQYKAVAAGGPTGVYSYLITVPTIVTK